MEVFFADKDLADSRKRKGKFSKVNRQLERRIEMMLSVDHLADLEKNYPMCRCHEYSGKEKGTFSVDLSGNWRLRFKPTEEPKYKKDGGIDKTSIKSVTIIDICDPH